eukprot:1954305-Pyramimonas_sp.AAC.1
MCTRGATSGRCSRGCATHGKRMAERHMASTVVLICVHVARLWGGNLLAARHMASTWLSDTWQAP